MIFRSGYWKHDGKCGVCKKSTKQNVHANCGRALEAANAAAKKSKAPVNLTRTKA